MRGEPGLQVLDAVAGQRRHHEGRVELRLARSIACASASSAGLSARSTLLSTSTFGCAHVGELAEDRLGLLVDPLLGVDQQRHDVGVVRAAPGGRHHRAVEPAPRREDARRVHQHELRVADDRDAAHQRARGLHLAADDRDLGADQRVGQRRLAGVRRADQRDEAAAPSSGGDVHRVSRSAIRVCTPSRVEHRGSGGLLGGALGAPDALGRRAASATSTATRNSGL